MARIHITVGTLFALTALCAVVTAQSPGYAPTMAPGYAPGYAPTMAPGYAPSSSAPGPSTDCFTKLFNVSDCLSYVNLGSNLTKPDEPCCPELAGLVESSPQCLCELLSSNQSDFNIDVNRALKLPSVCGVSTPPYSLCSLFGITVDIPTPAPAPVAGGGPSSSEPPSAVASAPSGNGSGASRRAFSAVGLGAAFLVAVFF